MYAMTVHRTFLGLSGGSLIHIMSLEDPRICRFDDDQVSDGAPLRSGAPVGISIKQCGSGVNLVQEGAFLSAVPGKEPLEGGRPSADTWETFVFVPEAKANELVVGPSPSSEMRRFRDRVLQLQKEGKPVKIYCGCGTVPRPGFLNLDHEVNAPRFFIENRDDYFLFPFANSRWDIPDNSVDYVFHEDFIEHITQCMQWQFLAEALRVMKPGTWHRVNTPNLIASMKRHSRFSEGFDGVYTGELQWNHVAILTPFALKEIAETIGYSEVIFTTRSHGVSPYAEYDFRPAPDRDDLGGNIYADLRK
jgi:hypothetical protein